MNVQRIAAFSDGNKGGNPAGVVLLKDPMTESEMRSIATEVGYSETAFAYPLAEDESAWRVRYFSPESEVPFCGHATIALGAVLGEHAGAGEGRSGSSIGARKHVGNCLHFRWCFWEGVHVYPA